MKNLGNNLLLVGAGLLIGAGFGLFLLLGLGVGKDLLNSRPVSEELQPTPSGSEPAPAFEAVSLDGKTVHLEDLRGRAVLVNFWATWCLPCRQEMPLIEDYARRYPDTLVVLAVNNDEPVDKVQAFVDELGLSLNVLLDPGGQIARDYRVRGFPTSVFIDAEGRLRAQHIGVLDDSLLEKYLKLVEVSE